MESGRKRGGDEPWSMSHSASSTSPFLTAMWRSVSRSSSPLFFGGGGVDLGFGGGEVALGFGGGAALGTPFVSSGGAPLVRDREASVVLGGGAALKVLFVGAPFVAAPSVVGPFAAAAAVAARLPFIFLFFFALFAPASPSTFAPVVGPASMFSFSALSQLSCS